MAENADDGADTLIILPSLPCPECRTAGRGGMARIGNRRRICGTCNRWAQMVMRETRKRLKERYEEEYELLRFQVESDLYPKIIKSHFAEDSK